MKKEIDDSFLEEFFALREHRIGGDVPLPDDVVVGIMDAVRLSEELDSDYKLTRATMWWLASIVVLGVAIVVGLLCHYNVFGAATDVISLSDDIVARAAHSAMSMELSLPSIDFRFSSPLTLMWVVILTLATGLYIGGYYLSRWSFNR